MAYSCAGAYPVVRNPIPDEQASANDRFAMIDASTVSCQAGLEAVTRRVITHR